MTVTHTPEGKAHLAKLDGEPTEMGSDEFTAYVKDEIAEWTELAKQLNLRAPKP